MCRLEYAHCGKAFSVDPSRLESGEDPKELGGGKAIWFLSGVLLKIRSDVGIVAPACNLGIWKTVPHGEIMKED